MHGAQFILFLTIVGGGGGRGPGGVDDDPFNARRCRYLGLCRVIQLTSPGRRFKCEERRIVENWREIAIVTNQESVSITIGRSESVSITTNYESVSITISGSESVSIPIGGSELVSIITNYESVSIIIGGSEPISGTRRLLLRQRDGQMH